MPGSGLHDVAMGYQGAAPVRAAQGILWFGRHPLHAVMGPALSGGRCLTLFWQAARQYDRRAMSVSVNYWHLSLTAGRTSSLRSLREQDPPAPDSALTLAKKAPRITPESPALFTPQELVESSCVAMLLS
jgi:hypothetical protein